MEVQREEKRRPIAWSDLLRTWGTWGVWDAGGCVRRALLYCVRMHAWFGGFVGIACACMHASPCMHATPREHAQLMTSGAEV